MSLEGKAALKDLRFVAHREINLDPRVYNAYAGRYKIAHDTVVTVTREGNRLMAEPTDDSNSNSSRIGDRVLPQADRRLHGDVRQRRPGHEDFVPATPRSHRSPYMSQ